MGHSETQRVLNSRHTYVISYESSRDIYHTVFLCMLIEIAYPTPYRRPAIRNPSTTVPPTSPTLRVDHEGPSSSIANDDAIID